MHDAQAAQGFDQVQFASIEWSEGLVALELGGELRFLLRAVTRQEHPEILNSRTGAGIVQVYKMKLITGNQDIARMEIAVQAKFPNAAGALEAGLDTVEYEFGDGRVSVFYVERYELLVQKEVNGVGAKCVYVDLWPLFKPVAAADVVDSRDKATELFQVLLVVELRRSTAATRVDRQSKQSGVMQRRAIDEQGGNDRNLGISKFPGKPVLFKDLQIAPALRPVELRDAVVALINAYLVYTVFVAVQGQQPAIDVETETRDSVENVVGFEGLKGKGRGGKGHRGGV